MIRGGRAALLLATVLGAACQAVVSGGEDPGLAGLALTSVEPGTVVPGSVIVIEGASFVDEPWGTARLHLEGDLDGREVELALRAGFVDFDRMEIPVDAAFYDAFGVTEGDFTGRATLEITSPVDGLVHSTRSLEFGLAVRRDLTPEIESVDGGGEMILVNDKIEVRGDGFLLGGDEGMTVAVVTGCFTEIGYFECYPVGPTEVPLVPGELDRTLGTFNFSPAITGIRAGSFQGDVRLVNRPQTEPETFSEDTSMSFEIGAPAIFSLRQSEVSLGQFVDIEGGGFAGGAQGGSTVVEFYGQFTPDDGDGTIDISTTLVPEWSEGRVVRYVINEDDWIGQLLDVRNRTGTFTGELTPIVQYDGDEVVGTSTFFSLYLAPVKQVIQLVFEPGYVESLRHFGLRPADARIRQRIVNVLTRDFATINLEVRLEPPTDFKLYSIVEVTGIDPNGKGEFGLDNTPGKDSGNLRLDDQIGGANATTNGYGGVFVTSMFSFSHHPEGLARKNEDAASDSFDDLFDPFRPDQDGAPVSPGEMNGADLERLDGSGCPAVGRRLQISCAIFVLGNMIGSTLSHEIGHSLGLANPYQEKNFHNQGDEPNRLMEEGEGRPFEERAEVRGQGPARFCVTEYEYLRDIMPADDPDDLTPRPTCL